MFLAAGPLMRAAIAGAGYIGRVHAIALRAIGVAVVAVGGGRTLEARRSSAKGLRTPICEALLDGEEVDVLHVCTPNAHHARQALAALERGIHVVCEKPLAISTGREPGGCVGAASDRGLVHATCYHARGYPLVEQMRGVVAAGDLGELAFAHGHYLVRRPPLSGLGLADRARAVRAGPTSSATSAPTGSISRSTSPAAG